MGGLIRRHEDARAFVTSLELNHSVRLHAALLLFAASFAGLMFSKVLLWSGLETPLLRFPVAVVLAYLVFIVLVNWWLYYLGLRRNAIDDAPDPGDVYSGGGSSDGAGPTGDSIAGKGGTFDGGGASGGWDAGAETTGAKVQAGLRVKGHATNAGFEAKGHAAGAALETKAGAFDLAAEAAGGFGEFFPVLALIAIVVGFVALLGWTMAVTPMVLIEIAIEAAIAAGLIRSTARTRAEGWFIALFERTVWKVAAVAAIAFLLGLAVRAVAPDADTIGEAVAHLMRP